MAPPTLTVAGSYRFGRTRDAQLVIDPLHAIRSASYLHGPLASRFRRYRPRECNDAVVGGHGDVSMAERLIPDELRLELGRDRAVRDRLFDALAADVQLVVDADHPVHARQAF